MNTPKRNVIMVVGATGSLGKAIVVEFRRLGVALRLLGRSWNSFAEEGFIVESDDSVNDRNKELDLVVCDDMTDRTAFHDDWFTDVRLVVCVARPRSLIPGDFASFGAFVQNLSDVVCANQVPRLLLHGLPFVEEFPFGRTPTMIARQRAEEHARDRFSVSSSHLTVSRINEMSEVGHLLEFAHMIGVWLCVRGYDPRLQPISPHDFALAVVRFAEKKDDNRQELLVGGPQVVKWRELGEMISTAIGRRLPTIAIPLCVFQICFGVLRFAKWLLPFLEGLENVVKLVATPMVANTTSHKFDTIGSDRLDEYLREHALSRESTYVRKRIFRFWRKPKPPNQAKLRAD